MIIQGKLNRVYHRDKGNFRNYYLVLNTVQNEDPVAISFQMGQDIYNKLAQLPQDTRLSISFSIKGRDYMNRDGEEDNFTFLMVDDATYDKKREAPKENIKSTYNEEIEYPEDFAEKIDKGPDVQQHVQAHDQKDKYDDLPF